MNYLYKFASFLFSYANADEGKKLSLLKRLEELSRTDEDFEQIKDSLFESDPELWGPLFSAIKKSPKIGLAEFSAEKDKAVAEKVKKDKIKADKEAAAYTEEEKKVAADFQEETFKKWCLRALKDSEVLRVGKETVDTAINKLDKIYHYWMEVKPDLFQEFQGPTSFDKAFEKADEWERDFTNVKIEGYVTHHVIYKTDSWEIVEIKGSEKEVDNDLKLEGKIMGHCVGGYAQNVMNKSSRIFSLRSSNNVPKATIETDSGIYQFKQIYGPGNRELDSEKFSIITEWKNNLHPKDKIITLSESLEEQDKINAAAFMSYDDEDYKNIINKLLVDSKDGNFSNNKGFNNENKSVIQSLSENETLSPELYREIYKKATESKTLTNLARNPKIPDDLFIELSKQDKPLDVRNNIASSRKIKDFPEIINNYFNSKDINLILILLNNPSIPSSICINYTANNVEKVITLLSTHERIWRNLEAKFIDDLLNGIKNSNIQEIPTVIIKIIHSNPDKIKPVSLYKVLNKFDKKYNKNSSIKEIAENIAPSKVIFLQYEEKNNVSKDKNAAPIDLLELSKENLSFNITENLLKNPNLPSEALSELCTSNGDNQIVINRIIRHEKLTPSILYKLLKFADEMYINNLRDYISSNENLTSESISYLYNTFLKKSDTNDSRYAEKTNRSLANILANKNTPLDILLEIYNKNNNNKNTDDYNNHYNQIIAANRNIPEELLTEFSFAEDNFVRGAVVINEKASFEILSRLSKDESPIVQEYFSRAKSPEILKLPEILINLAKKSVNKDRNISWNIAQNKFAPFEALKILMNDEFAVNKVIENPNMPADFLYNFALNKNYDSQPSLSNIAFILKQKGFKEEAKKLMELDKEHYYVDLEKQYNKIMEKDPELKDSFNKDTVELYLEEKAKKADMFLNNKIIKSARQSMRTKIFKALKL